jgi:hypothetical protein
VSEEEVDAVAKRLPFLSLDQQNMTFTSHTKPGQSLTRDSFLHKHSNVFLQSRQDSVETFHEKLASFRRRVPEQQDIKEYQEKISQRLDYIRRKRRSLAAQNPESGAAVFKSMVGSAISYDIAMQVETDAGKDGLAEVLLGASIGDKPQQGYGKLRTNFRGRNQSVTLSPKYADVREKFGRAFGSKVYEDYRQYVQRMALADKDQSWRLKTLRPNDATQIIDHLVRETKYMQRTEHSSAEIKAAAEHVVNSYRQTQREDFEWPESSSARASGTG